MKKILEKDSITYIVTKLRSPVKIMKPGNFLLTIEDTLESDTE